MLRMLSYVSNCWHIHSEFRNVWDRLVSTVFTHWIPVGFKKFRGNSLVDSQGNSHIKTTGILVGNFESNPALRALKFLFCGRRLKLYHPTHWIPVGFKKLRGNSLVDSQGNSHIKTTGILVGNFESNPALRALKFLFCGRRLKLYHPTHWIPVGFKKLRGNSLVDSQGNSHIKTTGILVGNFESNPALRALKFLFCGRRLKLYHPKEVLI